MTELRGLSVLVNTSGTLHSIEEPPEEEAPDEEFDAWWARTHLWHTKRDDS